jgi:hypothetical protein
MHDPGAALAGGGVVGDVHPVHELGLAGEVDVVRAGLRAGGDQRLAVQQVGPDGGDYHPGAVGDVLEGDVVSDVGGQQRQVAEPVVDAREVLAYALELVAAATGQRPAQTFRAVPGEVLRGEASGEAGGAEEDEVELAVGG